MNRQPQQSEPDPQDAGLDPELLEQALGQPTPDSSDGGGEAIASLEAQILALTDPQMLSLLDEALAAKLSDASANQLAERILVATTAATALGQTEPQRTPAVVGRITPASALRYAMAAAIALAAGAGVWFIATHDANTPGQPIVKTTPDNTQPNDPQDIDDIAFPTDDALFADATRPIQADINALSDGLDDARIDRDSIWSDMDAYEQFLTDLESDLDTSST